MIVTSLLCYAGLELPELHHMECGNSRVSSLYKDRNQYEKLYTFCTYIVWVCFKRREMEAIKREIGRILKSDFFNPHARPQVGSSHTSFSDRAKMSETSYIRSVMSAN